MKAWHNNVERRWDRQKARMRKAATRARHRNCTPVYCWVCGHREWRPDAPFRTMQLVFDRTTCVRVFGRCGEPQWPNDEIGCDGIMVLESDRRMVVQDAVKWDEAGYNHNSEYDV